MPQPRPKWYYPKACETCDKNVTCTTPYHYPSCYKAEKTENE